MPIRSSSPLSESLLWKARLTQHNAHLRNEKDALRLLVKDLGERVAAAETKAQSITKLADRVTALEEDDKKQQECFEALDHDRQKRLLRLEDDGRGLWRKVRGVGERIEEVVEGCGVEQQTRAQGALVMQARVEDLEAGFTDLVERCGGFTAGIKSLQEGTIRETGGLQLRVKSLEEKIKAGLAQRGSAVDVSSVGPRVGQANSDAMPLPTKQPTQKIPQPTTQVVRGKAKVRKGKPAQPPKQVAVKPMAGGALITREQAIPASGRKVGQQPNQRISQQPAVLRTRTTRHGHTGEAIRHESDADEGVVKGTVAHAPTRTSIKRPRNEDKEESEENRPRASSSQHAKRAKQNSTATRLCLNLKTAADAGTADDVKMRADPTPVPVSAAALISGKPSLMNVLTAPTSGLANNLPTATAPPPQQQASSRSAKPRTTYRRRIRMPNLPPTPPPLSP